MDRSLIMRLNTPHKNSNHCDQSENLYFTFSDLLRFLVVVIIVLLAFSIMVSINNTYVNKTSLLLGIFFLHFGVHIFVSE